MKRETITASVQMAGRVERYHTWPMITRQTVGLHCWRVATLYVEIFGLPRAEVIYYCLHHDSGELSAGDAPFGAKKLSAGYVEGHRRAEIIGLKRLGIELPVLTEQEMMRVKTCDLAEMWETGKIELHMGNEYAEPIVLDTLESLLKNARESGDYEIIYEWLGRQRTTQRRQR